MTTQIDTSKLDESKRKHRNNAHANRLSTAEKFKQDVLNFINDIKSKTSSKYFIVTVIKKHDDKIYWHIEQPDSVHEMKKKAQLNDDNIIFYHVNITGINEINKSMLQ